MERLPPLNAIKAFEVAARTGNFTLAATELGVSSAAVSQQVRNLETWFGKQLFVRSGNRIALIPQNPASAKVLKKAGMRREGYLRKHLRVHGEWHDSFLYAILREEWRR